MTIICVAKGEHTMSKKIIPITLLTGYLGAGKTTLLNYVLNNKQNYKVAVIVNDIGEVNIDASLIGAENIVSQKDDSLVPLQNGCICCTLKQDLMAQIAELVASNKFDYIMIEASGICEPIPIVQSITLVSEASKQYNLPSICRLDNVVSVVDTLRLAREFGCGDDLTKENIDDEDIENLIIQQIEFCNKIILNKIDQVSEEEKNKVKAVIKKLQPEAEIIEAEFGKVDVGKIIGTNAFDFDKACMSAGWLKELDNFDHDDHDDHDEHDEHDHDEHNEHEGHEHGGHHHHHESEVEEYGIGSFVYYRRKPLVKSKFRNFAEHMPRNIIRSKGIVWFSNDNENMYIFEQAGVQTNAYRADVWIDTLNEEDKKLYIEENPDIMKDWDKEIGDRMVKLVFIGQKMDKDKIIKELDACLDK